MPAFERLPEYSRYEVRWFKGSPHPSLKVFNKSGEWVANIRGQRARTLLGRLKAGVGLTYAMKGLL